MRVEDLVYFCAPSRLVMGAGCRKQLPALLRRLGYRRGLLVTDTFFTGATPWVDELVAGARAHDVELLVCDGGMPDPTTTLCDAATAAVRERLDGMPVDHVIALGGGSNIDLAKALCLTLPGGKPVRAFLGSIDPGTPILPLVAMPTTAGTGSEATPGAILVDPDNATKVAVMDNRLRPAVALVDPEFTYTCPPRVTADAGIDALTHAIESYLTIDSASFDCGGEADPGYSGRNALTMLFAHESIRLCGRYLLRTYQDGSDSEARIGMSYASVYAALSYGSAGLNAVHGIAYAVAGQTHLSHGTTNAVMLPYVLDALADVRREELLAIARLLDISDGDAGIAVARVPVVVRELVAAVGLPTTLQACGIGPGDVDALVRDALAVTRLAKAFPVPDVAARYGAMVRKAWAGTLSGAAHALAQPRRVA
ncbi:iron-containing alcohol dehydrogenase [Cupriavidus taiwanensis]|uniref:iron-containing alcohol dehydrogenase n=1 Tax=Cupriavidus taiwanensis TaxID=164546 RepID=UPI000E141330|nr:iron-containing alcohol dehydrogenase [Cupriavidus taiwanensis]SOZ28326.1 putative Iron-containing alcohol dehydrogenase [Cupriavidus taiwanensis]SPA33060.1 putative Iron-containing alcohol dehydrogenase [Cupriavidus taiwanensis]